MEWGPLHIGVICILQGRTNLCKRERRSEELCFLYSSMFFRYPSDTPVGFLNVVGVCYPQIRSQFILCSGNKLHKLWKLEAVWHLKIQQHLQAYLKVHPQANLCFSCSSPASYVWNGEIIWGKPVTVFSSAVSWPCSLPRMEPCQHWGGGGADVGRGGTGDRALWAGTCALQTKIKGLRCHPILHPRVLPAWHGCFIGSSSRESYLWVYSNGEINGCSSMCYSGAAGEDRALEAPSQSSLETEAPWNRHGFWSVSFCLHKTAFHKRRPHQ